MKKSIMGVIGFVILMASSTTMASSTYECWGFVDGMPNELVQVSADSSEEATKLAKEKMTKLDIKFDSVMCK